MEKSTENSVGGLPSWMGPQGTTRIVMARLMETQTCQLCGEGLEKTTNGLCQLFCLEEYRPPPPPSLSLVLILMMPDNPVPPGVSLVALELLPQCWISERISLTNSFCVQAL